MDKAKQTVYLVGMGMGNFGLLSEDTKKMLEACGCIIGSKRMVEEVASMKKPVYESYQPEEIQLFLKEHLAYENIVIALSGDPGFYSGAKKLKETLLDCNIQIIPGVSSITYLAAVLGISWDDAAIASIHGRQQNFIHTITKNHKTFLLFGGQQGGQMICEKIKHYGLDDVMFYIGKNLSYPNEEIVEKAGAMLTEEDFDGLAAAYIINPHPDANVCVHMSDEEFVRGEVPMTKAEIRTVSIANLHLTKDAVLYDVGAGTGSVSIEAARQSGEMRVYAIEKNPQAIALIKQNRQKFCCDHVEIVEGLAPAVLEALEKPTHVFIGGSAGNLKEILTLVKAKNPDVRIVLNAISLETIKDAMEAMEDGILEDPEIVQLMVSKTRKLGSYHMMTGQNPVYIISAGKAKREKE